MNSIYWAFIGFFIGGFLFYQIGFGFGVKVINSFTVEGNTVEGLVTIDTGFSHLTDRIEYLETLLSLKEEVVESQNKRLDLQNERLDLTDSLFRKYKQLYEIEVDNIMSKSITIPGNIISDN